MAPSKWDDEEDSGSFGSDSDNSPPPPQIARRGKFDDEEDDADILDSWDAAEDSEVEREKAKKAAEAKAKAEAEAKANKKSRSQRIEEKREQNRLRREIDGLEDSEEEVESDRLARMRQEEKENDLKHAEDLFGDSGVDVDVDVDRKSNSITIKADPPKPKTKPAEPKDIFSGIGVNPNRANAKAVVNISDPNNEGNTIDLASLKLFNPVGKPGFDKLRDTLVPLLTQNSKKPQYTFFMQEFAKALVRDLPSEQIKKVASGLTTLSNEKMKEEKAAEKGGKKSKAAKTKTTLNASRDTAYKADTEIYDDGLDDGDFM